MTRLRPLLACIFALCIAAPLAAQPVRFEAEIVDADDGTPLPGATAQVEGTDRGDASDASGRVVLTLETLPADVVVRFVGYASATLSLKPGDARDGVIRRVVRLSPAPYVMGEVAISAEPPGERIWRRVLARKATLARQIGSYSAEAYTRFLLVRDGRLDVRPVPIRLSESLSNLAWLPVSGLREEIVARRRRPDGGPFRWADQGPIPDLLFEDWLWLDGQRILGPGHPDAIRHYAFRLGETVEVDGMRMLDFAIVPRGPGLLAGRIRVVDSLWVVSEATLRASIGASGAAVQSFDAEHRWTYEPVWAGTALRDSLWLPAAYVREGRVDAGVLGMDFPAVRFRQRSQVSLHRVGGSGADVSTTQRFWSPAGVYGGNDPYRFARRSMPLDSLEVRADTSALLGRVELKEMLKPQEGIGIGIFGIQLGGLRGFSVEGEDD
ncbi:carboxypeptidase-like regulatory domain-containing protein [Rubricoccus marinus]|uniref:Carboxypeptidase-like regulatory domain-containing protein n=1 Tax=Rubricoccus marinus TaxID=716817 RepID=A0A259TY49_9BACT|nr:carboxypeptidase-like regulatory domain-containing protein [Rubricoccus marinus]OZC02547.1 hypothetical protein BSZ36_05885 [Rubricoccus marinus]